MAVPPEAPSVAMTPDDVLRAFNIPSTCEVVQREVGDDPTLSDAQRVERIRRHRTALEQLCKRVAADATRNKSSAMATVHVAATMLAQVRVAFLGVVAQVQTMGDNGDGDDDATSAVGERCRELVNSSAPCAALCAYERELLQRVSTGGGVAAGRPTAHVRGVVQRGKDYIVQGFRRLGKTTGWVATEWVVRRSNDLFWALLPSLWRLVLYILQHPKAALFALIFVHKLQRMLCREITRLLMGAGQAVVRGTYLDVALQNLSDIAGTAAEYAANVGPGQLALRLAQATGAFIRTHGQQLLSVGVDAILAALVGATAGTFGVAALPAGAIAAVAVGIKWIGGMVLDVVADVTEQAVEFAVYEKDVENAFAQLFRVMTLQGCTEGMQQGFRKEVAAAKDAAAVKVDKWYLQTRFDRGQVGDQSAMILAYTILTKLFDKQQPVSDAELSSADPQLLRALARRMVRESNGAIAPNDPRIQRIEALRDEKAEE